MPERDIIVIGASAGGVQTLLELVAGLPAALPAAVFITVHVPAEGRSYLPAILSRAGPLPAIHARDGEATEAGRIYIAPPNNHLLVERDAGRDVMRLDQGPKVNSARPAIDPLFSTAAQHYGIRVVGVVLSGMLSDGTVGLMQVKQHGGAAVVQDPDDALVPSMPRSAIENVAVDYTLPAHDIGPLLARLAEGQEDGQ